MSVAYQRVQAHLERLKLKRVADLLDPIAEAATKESLSYVDFLDRLLEAESSSRAERRLIAKTRLAQFRFIRRLPTSTSACNPPLIATRSRSWRPCDSSLTARTSSCSDRLGWARHLANGLGVEAVAHGHNVYLIGVPELLNEVVHDVQMNRLGERLNRQRVPTQPRIVGECLVNALLGVRAAPVRYRNLAQCR